MIKIKVNIDRRSALITCGWVSIIMLLASCAFSLYLLTEYKDVLDLAGTIGNQTGSNQFAILQIMDRFHPGYSARIVEFQERQNQNLAFLIFSLIIFTVSGIPNLKKTFSNPASMIKLSESDKKIIERFRRLFSGYCD